MTDKSLRPGGGRGVVCHAAEPIGHGRKSFARKGLRVPASVPVKFTDLVNIPGWRVFPGLAFPVHCPPPFPLLVTGTLVTRTLSLPAHKKAPAGWLPAGAGCSRWPSPGRYATHTAPPPPAIPSRPPVTPEPRPSVAGRERRGPAWNVPHRPPPIASRPPSGIPPRWLRS